MGPTPVTAAPRYSRLVDVVGSAGWNVVCEVSDGPVPVDGLAAALALGRHEHVAVVGGGGKTTIVHALAQQLRGSRIVTTTTKMGYDQQRALLVVLAPTGDDGADERVVAAAVPDGAVMAWRSIEGTRAIGVAPEACDRWFERVDHVLVEADGSRRRPFKAPGPNEPVVPSTTTVMVSVIGADALGAVIADGCHRPLVVAELAGCDPDDRLTPERAARVLLHERGQRRACPDGARLVVAMTKVGPTNIDLVAAVVAAVDGAVPVLMIALERA
ncbi:MAG: selenium cofactor biosynthesis protein YqeC [Acidimicrobiales bacterium]